MDYIFTLRVIIAMAVIVSGFISVGAYLEEGCSGLVDHAALIVRYLILFVLSTLILVMCGCFVMATCVFEYTGTLPPLP
jgi:hypothetical protein